MAIPECFANKTLNYLDHVYKKYWNNEDTETSCLVSVVYKKYWNTMRY
jgi:hypothetical protein